MTIVTPAQSLHYAKQLEINALAAVPANAPHATQAAQRLKAAQEEHVNSLIASQHLSATTVLNTVTINRKTHPLWTQRTALQTLATGTTPAAQGYAATLAAVEAQLVAELMLSGDVSGATILAHPSLSYVGN